MNSLLPSTPRESPFSPRTPPRTVSLYFIIMYSYICILIYYMTCSKDFYKRYDQIVVYSIDPPMITLDKEGDLD
jgi:hypothetical protein